MSTIQESAALNTCDNCATVLVGGYCHVCGQRAHNPLHDLRHAAEEVFESFWHLDGRIFVTLRGLFSPGRVASEFLAGKRAKYIPPLRLFLIMSVLTFFVGRFTVHMSPVELKNAQTGEVQTHGMEIGLDAVNAAGTVEGVLKARENAQQEIANLRGDPVGSAVLATFGTDAERDLQAAVLARLLALHATPAQLRSAGFDPDAPGRLPDPAPDAEARTPGAKASEGGFLARWFRHKLERAQQNVAAIRHDPDTLVRLVLGAVPGALLMLMPVFALCLKLLYIRSHRSYLEHLVVAMYSHVAMLGALLMAFLALGLQLLVGGGAMAAATGVFCTALFGIAMPVYLLLMQKRVYAQGWFKTLVKYILLGNVYTMLLVFALVYAAFAGISS